MRVLYFTNIEVPYRNVFFNKLSEDVDLTVLFERSSSSTRNLKWAQGVKRNFKSVFLKGIHIGGENAISFSAFHYVLGKFDRIIFGCYNSPVQVLCIFLLHVLGVKFFINSDGELPSNSDLKSRIRLRILSLAECILTAGEKSAENLRELFPEKKIISYYFSSLCDEEIAINSNCSEKRNDIVLVVGQYQRYKGLDIAVAAAGMNPNIRYRFIGVGSRYDSFVNECNIENMPNVEVVAFMDKEDLQVEYKTCKVLVLPSRKECWGLVINEAASFGTPIVSTFGSGAAVEFLSGSEFEKYLAKSDDPESLYESVQRCLALDTQSYSEYLKEKSRNYSIEKSVASILAAIK